MRNLEIIKHMIKQKDEKETIVLFHLKQVLNNMALIKNVNLEVKFILRPKSTKHGLS